MRVGMQIEDLRALLQDCPKSGSIMIEVESDTELPTLDFILTDGYECADGMVLIAAALKPEE